jgi:hypothetical protein
MAPSISVRAASTAALIAYLAQIPGDNKVMLPPFIASLSVACYTHDKTQGSKGR